MFKGASEEKVRAILELGLPLNSLFFHDTIEDARDAAKSNGELPWMRYVPPFDSSAVMAGQSTIMEEFYEDLVQQHNAGRLDMFEDEIVMSTPGGGGGCAAGMAARLHDLKRRGLLANNVRFYVTQMEGSNALACKIRGTPFGRLDSSCDGTAVSEAGELTSTILRDEAMMHDIVVVPKSWVGKSMLIQEAELGHPVEPAGALSLAGAAYLQQTLGATVNGRPRVFLTLMSGGNVSAATRKDFARAAT